MTHGADVKIRFAILTCLLLTSLGAGAQTSDEIAQIRQELMQLTQRVDTLEAQNVALRAENAELRRPAQAVELASAPQTSKSADWPNRISLKGDLRYRHEQTNDRSQASDRERDLLRARVSLEAKATDDILIGIGLSTTENGNPRGANQTLDGEFSRKSLDLDLGYFKWAVAEEVHAIGGKMRMPLFRPGQSLFFDNDINPEGFALTYAGARWFGSSFRFWVDENVPESGSTATDADTMMSGGQLGLNLPF